MAANGVLNTTAMQKRYRGKYDNPRPKSNLQQLKDFLKRELADGKRVHKQELLQKAKDEGLKTIYMPDAKTSLGIVGERSTERPGQVVWCLPDAEPVASVQVEATIDPVRTHHQTEDEFSITPAERKMYGIRDNEQVVWIRDPNYWKGKVPGDPVRMFQRDNQGGRVILHNNEFVTNGIDVILAVRPMQEVENLRKREQEEADKIAHENAGLKREDDFDRSDDERLMMRKLHNSQEHVRAGMIGPQSPSSGMAYEDYVKYRGLTKAEIEQEELRYSLGARLSRELSDEQAEAAMQANRRAGSRSRGDSEGEMAGERGSAGRGGSKFYSLPPNIRPRNLAQK